MTRQFSYEVEGNEQDASFLNRARDGAMKILRENKNKKGIFVLTCEMSRLSIVTGEETTRTVPFLSKCKSVLEATDLEKLYDTVKEEILENMSKYSSNGSNWKVSNILKMDINMINYNPLSALSWIELDKFLTSKKAIINMQNEDNECFKWCVTRALNMKNKNNERIDKELIEKPKELNWKLLNQIAKFEKNNPDISVFVFWFINKEPIPLKELKNYGRKHHIDLLLISNEMNNHYSLINDFSRLMTSSKSKHHGKKYYCRNCLRGYNSEEALSKHWPYCKEHSCVRIELPKEGTFMKVTNIERSMRVPFVVYADFESFIKPINTCDPDEKQSFTKQHQKHAPSSFCYYIKCFDDTVYKGKLVTYTASSETDDVAGKFVEMLEKDIIEIYERTKFPKKMVMTDEDKKNYNDAKVCHICKENLGNGKVQKTNKDHCHICKEIIGNRKVRDHCHLTGKYRGAAHN